MAEETINLFEINIDVKTAVEDTKRLKEEIEQLKAQAAKAKDEQGELSTEYLKYASALKTAQNELRVNEKLTQNLIKANTAKKDSIDQLRADLAIVTQKWNALSGEERQNTEAGKALTAEKTRLTEALKKEEMATGDARRNVGNYKEAVDLVNMSLGDLRKELIALKNTSFEGKSQEEIDQLKTRIADVTETMKDMKAEMVVMGTEASDVFVSGLKYVAASVEGVVGTLSLLGVESDVIQRLEQKMTSLIAVTQALSELEDGLTSGRLKAIAVRIKDMVTMAAETVSKWANATATAAQTKAEEAKLVMTGKASLATKAITALQWLWNAAIAANPIGAIVAGIAALVAGIVVLTKVMGKNNDETERRIDLYEEIKKAHERERVANEFQLEYNKALGKSSTELYNQQRANLYKRQQDIEAEMKALSELKDGDIETQRERQKAYEEYAKQYDAIGNEILLLSANYQREQDAIAEKARQDEIDRENKKNEELLKLREKLAEEKQRIADQELQWKNEQIEREIELDIYFTEQQEERERVKAEKAAQALQDQIDAANWLRESEDQRLNDLQQAELEHIDNIAAAQREFIYAQIEAERQRLVIQEEQEIAYARSIGANVTAIEAKYSAARKAIAKAERDAKLAVFSDLAGNLAQLFGENTVAGKIAAAAQATIQTYLGAVQAYTAASVFPPPAGQIIGAASAAAIVATGLANVKKILSVKTGLPGDSGGSFSGAGSASVPASTGFSTVTPEVGQGIISRDANNNQPAAIQLQPTLVVDDVTNKQSTQKNINVTQSI